MPGLTRTRINIVPVESNVYSPCIRTRTVGLFQVDGQSLGYLHTPPVNTNQGQGFHALHILCYFMGDPGDRPAHPIRIHQDLAALCHLASHSLLLKSPSSQLTHDMRPIHPNSNRVARSPPARLSFSPVCPPGPPVCSHLHAAQHAKPAPCLFPKPGTAKTERREAMGA